jgi:hypothetical protein
VSVASGQQLEGIDFRLKSEQGFTVNGQVLSADGTVPSIGVVAFLDDARGRFQAAATATDPSGAFTLFGLPSGNYVLRAQRGSSSRGSGPGAFRGETQVTVGPDTGPVALNLVPGARLRGGAVFTGSESGAPAGVARRIRLVLHAAAGDATPYSIPLVDDHAFAQTDLPAGAYFATVSGLSGGWSLREIVADGKNVVGVPLDLRTGSDVHVTAVFTDRAPVLRGHARADAREIGEIQVVVFVDGQKPDSLRLPESLTRVVLAERDGSFVVPGLVAGRYLVVALPAAIFVDLSDRTVLTRLRASATAVTLENEDAYVSPTVTRFR